VGKKKKKVRKSEMCTCPVMGIGNEMRCKSEQGHIASSDYPDCGCDCHKKKEGRTGYVRKDANPQYLINGRLPFPPPSQW